MKNEHSLSNIIDYMDNISRNKRLLINLYSTALYIILCIGVFIFFGNDFIWGACPENIISWIILIMLYICCSYQKKRLSKLCHKPIINTNSYLFFYFDIIVVFVFMTSFMGISSWIKAVLYISFWIAAVISYSKELIKLKF